MNLPLWLDMEAWVGWIEMRRAMKRVPFTERAQRIAMRQLEGWHAQGYDVGYILDEATLKGWRGLFINERTPRVHVRQELEPMTPHIKAILEKVNEAERGAKQRFIQGYCEQRKTH